MTIACVDIAVKITFRNFAANSMDAVSQRFRMSIVEYRLRFIRVVGVHGWGGGGMEPEEVKDDT